MNGSGQKVLIIDDTVANIQILREVFAEEYRIFFATSGIAGIEIARRERPDIILLDVMMPGMDGYETCSILKSDQVTAAIPVIFVTALGEESDETKGLEAGAIDYLTKPISPPIVRVRVKNHLALKSAKDKLENIWKELTVKNAILEKERILAHALLEKLLPAKILLPGFSTAVCYRPSDAIGGDFYDGWLDGDNVHFLIADISGHSVSAALLMAVCRGLFMTIGKGMNDPALIISDANRVLVSMLTESGMFLTMVYLVYNRKSNLLKVASAGHVPAYLCRGSSMISMKSSGPPIGWDSDDQWGVESHRLQEGDKIILYTDGLIEIRSPSGENCPEEIFSRVDVSHGAQEMVAQIMEIAAAFCHDRFDDDVTVLVVSADVVGALNGETP